MASLLTKDLYLAPTTVQTPHLVQFNYFQEIDILFSITYERNVIQPVFCLLYCNREGELWSQKNSSKQIAATLRNQRVQEQPQANPTPAGTISVTA